MTPVTLQEYFAQCIRRLLVGLEGRQTALSDGLVATIEDLSPDELHGRPMEGANSIAWEAWHIVRTVDQSGAYALGSRDTVWARDGLAEKWDLPERRQGTGMPEDEAHALRLPEPEAFIGYIHDVADDMPGRIAALSGEELGEIVRLGDSKLRRAEFIGDILIAHSAGHLGQISMLRQLLGKPGVGL